MRKLSVVYQPTSIYTGYTASQTKFLAIPPEAENRTSQYAQYRTNHGNSVGSNTVTRVLRARYNANGKSHKYVCITTNQPDTKSNPNYTPTTKQLAVAHMQLNSHISYRVAQKSKPLPSDQKIVLKPVN